MLNGQPQPRNRSSHNPPSNTAIGTQKCASVKILLTLPRFSSIQTIRRKRSFRPRLYIAPGASPRMRRFAKKMELASGVGAYLRRQGLVRLPPGAEDLPIGFFRYNNKPLFGSEARNLSSLPRAAKRCIPFRSIQRQRGRSFSSDISLPTNSVSAPEELFLFFARGGSRRFFTECENSLLLPGLSHASLGEQKANLRSASCKTLLPFD
jgi:hypothetical protein